ncbi:winged helix-turn-helix domain-containing protein [Halorussus ruber]|uniref:winged helix-turn-helix domain-containing protein n=1 Tax=Halorussus ruber TaxID=1126238 RepID=UPI001FE6235E|nr:helix-turn-helix domain-containing protein [Halorussus ruber]
MSDTDDGPRSPNSSPDREASGDEREVERNSEAPGDERGVESNQEAPDEVVAERLPPEEAFELLAHDLRFRILEVLNDADGALAFSGLRERVGVDDPGQFNYHLGKLTDRFVRSADEGYELAPPGRRIVGAVLSGGYTKILDADPVETDARCIVCGSRMAVEFRDDGVEIRCGECEETLTNTSVPAGILEGVAPAEVPEVVDQWLKRVHAAADFGFCSNCDGRFEAGLVVAGQPDAPDWLDGEEKPRATVRYECDRCGFEWTSFPPSAVLLHPAVVGFHYDHGIDVRETPLWDLDWLGIDVMSVESADPPEVEISVTLDGETATFTFDADLNLVAERRE